MKNLCYAIVLLAMLSCKNDTKQVEDVKVETNLPDVKFQHLKSVQLYKGEIHRVDSFPSQYIKTRPVDVWLPEDYVEEKEYAVLYMHDGQMLFDAKTTWNKQEWKVDEWASRLMEDDKTKDFIVVAIHNIPEIRWQDLFPQKAINFIDKSIRDSLVDIAGKKNIKLSGDNYLKFIVKELKPQIDKTYSVHAERESTFVMGSSMGGLMSMYAISEYPDIFGGAACLSTHWVGAMPTPNNPYPEAIFKYMETNLPDPDTHKLYFDYGNKTLDKYYPMYAKGVDDLLEAAGFNSSNSKNLFFEGTDHSENSWNMRLDVPLQFLLGN